MKHTRREFVRILFAASQAGVAGRILQGSLFAEPAATENGLNFIVFGDWGREAEADQVGVATQMAKASKAMGAKFVISVGDNFYEDGVASTEDKQWKDSFEAVYDATALQIPWRVILGNHDYHGNCDAQIAYSKISHRWGMPERYYTRTERIDANALVDFFYIDTTPMIKLYYDEAGKEKTRANVITQDVPKQMAWFKRSLAASKAEWKIVVGHHPIYSGGDHGDTAELIESILPLLHEYKVQAYFCGHDHDLQHLTAGDVNLFISGAGSQVRPTTETEHTKFAQSSSGLTTVSLHADRMNLQMIDINGTVVYETTVPRG